MSRRHRVVCLPLIELQQPFAIRTFNHACVLLRRLALLKHPRPRNGLGSARREKEQRSERRGHHEMPTWEGERRDESHGHREDQECTFRSDERDQHKRGQKCAEQRAERREGVQVTRGPSHVLYTIDTQPDRPGRDRAEQQHGNRDQREHSHK